MKHKSLGIAFLAFAAFVAGCDQKQTASQQLDEVKTEAKAAARDMKDYTFAQKTEFIAKMQDELDILNKDLAQLSARIERSSDAVKTEAKPKLQALRDEVSQLHKQLEDARNATESTWTSVKAGSEKAYGDLKNGFQQARQWASDKIAP